MKKCYYCKKIVWPWQSEYLGTTPAHKKCDIAGFNKEVYKLVESGIMDITWAQYNTKMRKNNCY
jgi:hypothetical protein